MKTIPRTANDFILQSVYQHGQITRAELTRITGLSPTTIVRLVADLRDQNLVTESRDAADSSGRGRPSDLLQINPRSGCAVGIEFGEGQFTAVITDAVGAVLHSTTTTGPAFAADTDTLQKLVVSAQDFAESQSVPWSQVRTLSLALHDVVSADGEWLAWNNLGRDPFPAREILGDLLHLPVHVEDVSRAFAEAEHRYGAGRGVADQLYVFIGSEGIGSGIFLNDTLIKSSSGIGGEIGHVVVEPGGILCQCGNRGCMVKYVVARVLVNRFKDYLEQGLISTVPRNGGITFAHICEAAERGDKVAWLVLQEAATYIARGLATTLNVLGTPVIIVGGQLRRAGSRFLQDLTMQLGQQVIPVLAQHIDVRYAELPGYAGAWGAALQALDRVWMDGSFAQLVLNGET